MRKQYSEYEKEQIIKLHKEKLYTTQIAKILNRSQTGIESFLKREGYELNKRGILDEEDYKLIDKLYREGYSCASIYKEYFSDKFKSSAMIEKYIRNQGISRGRYSKEVIVNHDYFECVDTERKAYWLGLLMSDGSVVNEKGNSWRVSIQLNKEDSYLIKDMLKDIESDRNVRSYVQPRKNGKRCVSVGTIYSKKMAKDLIRHGVIPNKSIMDLLMPDLNPNLIPHFIRGYFDGDGGVSVTQRKDQRIKTYTVFICGSRSLINDISNFIYLKIGYKCIISDMNKYGVNIHRLDILKNQAKVDFYKLIYKDATVYMKRKREKIEQFMNERNIKY